MPAHPGSRPAFTPNCWTERAESRRHKTCVRRTGRKSECSVTHWQVANRGYPDAMTVEQRTRPPQRRTRRDEILEIAVGLFATRGYHGVSMDDIGAAAGVTGPALYHHFAGKEAMLIACLTPVSQVLLDGGWARIAAYLDGLRAAL